MSIRATIPLEVVCGATWQETFLFDEEEPAETFTPVDITGWDAILTVDTGERIAEYTLESGHLTIDGVNGTVSLEVPPVTTLRYPNPGTMAYELRLIEPGGEVRSLISGSVTVLNTVRP